MRIDLLKSLSKALKEVPEENYNNFYMRSWMVGKHKLKKRTLSCGTTACAIGLASTLPDWKKAGLTMTIGRIDSGNTDWYPVFKGYYNDSDWFGGPKFLGIKESDFNYIFGGFYERTPKEEAKVIDDFITRIMKIESDFKINK